MIICFGAFLLCICRHSVVFDSLPPHGLYSLPGSSVHGIFQAGVLEWFDISYSRGSLSNPGIEPTSLASPALAGGFFTTSTTWEAQWKWEIR